MMACPAGRPKPVREIHALYLPANPFRCWNVSHGDVRERAIPNMSVFDREPEQGDSVALNHGVNRPVSARDLP